MTDEESSLRRRLAELARKASDDLDDSGVLAVDILSASGVCVDLDETHRFETGTDSDTEGEGPGASLDGLLPEEAVNARYQMLGILGEGGMGRVHLAFDRNLGRQVAVKTIPPERMKPRRLGRFVAEARITAQLEHPGIVPIHDLFVAQNGDVYYTMKRVQGRTLRELIDDLRAEVPSVVARYTPAALIGIFRSACQAVAYAHQRGIIHRDLKPDNIMIGDFGEVLLMDWGVARSMSAPPEELVDVASEEGIRLHTTADGAMIGSPAYMSPEALQGEMDQVDARSDVFSLGVILYELLTLKRPFGAENLARLMYLVVRGDFKAPAQRAPDREIPEEIEETCMRALAADPERRFPHAAALAESLTDWLDGVRPRQEAERLLREGRSLLKVYQAHATESEEALLKATTLQAELKPWDPLEMKRLAWQAQREHADAVAAADRVFGDCEASFESALSHIPGHRPSQLGLAELYWQRFLEAEEARDPRWMRRWEELIRRYAPDSYGERLRGEGSLRVLCEPTDALVTVHPLSDEDGRLCSTEGVPLQLAEDGRMALPMGPYNLRITAPGHVPVTVPLLVQRLQHLELEIRVPGLAEVPDGFVVIPASTVVLGGDPDALSGLPETVAHVGSFALARHPVTVRDYFEFLGQLQQRDPLAAIARTPRRRGALASGDPPLFDLDPAAPIVFPTFDREGREWLAEQPIVGIGAEDAEAFTRWWSERSGDFSYRLPTEAEWEKAARGVGRRIFPWGNRFDANFCIMAESSEVPPSLPRIGASETDLSPYEVSGLAGGVRDWCTWGGEDEGSEGFYPARGGSYTNVEIYSRCASRSVRRSDHVGFNIGFRLAVTLD